MQQQNTNATTEVAQYQTNKEPEYGTGTQIANHSTNIFLCKHYMPVYRVKVA